MDHVISYFRETAEISLSRIAEIITGDEAGQRAIVSGSEPDKGAPAFFREHENVLRESPDGLVVIDGRTVFIETVGRPAELVICGGGHVSEAVTKIARLTGYHVTVFEDRPLFADRARKAGANIVLCDSFENNLTKTAGGDNIYYLILTRGHRFDLLCLRDLLKKPYAYIGMISSRGRAATAKNALIEEGYPREALESLHAPIGLKIGAETPAEIAVSIMAEIIECHSRVRAGSGFSKEILKGLDRPGGKVLATIIERHGSAPRERGTKMLIHEDGSTSGTIGGGCAEAGLITLGRQMLAGLSERTRIETIDMSVSNAEDDGMVCGGRIKVFLERVED